MTTASAGQSDRRTARILLIGATVLLFVALLGLLFALNMQRKLNHDEHQFIASAALIAREGLTPYVDFPYFHVPLLGYLYASLFRLFDSLLLIARLLSIFFGWAMLMLFFGLGWRRRHDVRPWARWWYAALATLWMAALPPFTYTSGRAWNHDLPLLLMLVAFFIHVRALRQRRFPLWLLLVSGLLMGAATATRLSFAITTIAFGLIIWLVPGQSLWERFVNSLIFSGGFFLGVLPAVILFAKDPNAFLFGNVAYVRLNTLYYRADGATVAMTLPGKLLYLGEQLALEPTALATIIALVIGLWPLRTFLLHPSSANAETKALVTGAGRDGLRLRLGFLGLVLLFTFVGALGATPSQPQYFYPLFPLFMIGVIEAFAAWPARLQPGVIYTYGLGAITAILVAISVYAPAMKTVLDPSEWIPSTTHTYGQFIRELTSEGRVLTLAPIYVVDGGGAVYPEFATGPFAWRVAPLMSADERRRHGVIGPDELEGFLDEFPPRAILTGTEDEDMEAPLIEYAQSHDFLPLEQPKFLHLKQPDASTLYLAPLARWADTIQLGAHTLPEHTLQPGDPFLLTLYLQSMQAMDTDYNLIIRMTDASGEDLLRDDGWPFGSPTSKWTPGEIWVDSHDFTVPAAEEGYYRVTVGVYDPATLDELGPPAEIGYLMVQTPGADRQTPTEAARFGDSLILERAAAALETGDAGQALTVDVTWRAAQSMARDYVVSVQVLDDAGQLIAQADAPPLGGFLPTSALDPALPAQDAIVVPMPDELPTGGYRVIIGVYDPETLQRLPVTVEDAPAGDAYTVASVGDE